MPSRRGDIVLALFPNSDLKTTKKRPALVVQTDGLNTGMPRLVVAMTTSSLSRAGHPTRVPISLSSAVGRRTNLITDSVIVTDNLATILETEISRTLGLWSDMASEEDTIRHTFGLR